MIGDIVGGVLIAAGVIWFVRGLLTAPRPPKGSIGSNEDMERLSTHYSAPVAILVAAGIMVLLWT